MQSRFSPHLTHMHITHTDTHTHTLTQAGSAVGVCRPTQPHSPFICRCLSCSCCSAQSHFLSLASIKRPTNSHQLQSLTRTAALSNTATLSHTTIISPFSPITLCSNLFSPQSPCKCSRHHTECMPQLQHPTPAPRVASQQTVGAEQVEQ